MTMRSRDGKMNFSPNEQGTLSALYLSLSFSLCFGRTHLALSRHVCGVTADTAQEHPYLWATDDGWIVKHDLTSLTQQGRNHLQKSLESLIKQRALVANFISVI